MTKNDLGKDTIKEIKQGRKARMRAQWNDTVLFAKRLVVTLFGLSILGLGIAATICPNFVNVGLWQYALWTAGPCAIVDGLGLMFYALVKIK